MGDVLLTDVYVSLQTIIDLLNRPAWSLPTIGQLRLSVDGGLLPTITTVTTIGTATTLTQIGGIPAYEALINFPLETNWCNNVRGQIH